MRLGAGAAASLGRRDFTADTLRRPRAEGRVVRHHDSHGLCYEVRHDGAPETQQERAPAGGPGGEKARANGADVGAPAT